MRLLCTTHKENFENFYWGIKFRFHFRHYLSYAGRFASAVCRVRCSNRLELVDFELDDMRPERSSQTVRQFVTTCCVYVLCTRLDIGNSLTRIFDCADILMALLTPLFSVVAMTRDHTSLQSVVAQHYPRNSHGWLAGVFGISLKLFH